MRTPFLIQYPGHIRPGTRVAAPIQNIDYAPTFLDYAGVKGPATIQGRSMTPLLAGRTPRDWRKDVYYHYYEFPGFHSVRAHYGVRGRSEEHTSELQSLMRISYADFCLK